MKLNNAGVATYCEEEIAKAKVTLDDVEPLMIQAIKESDWTAVEYFKARQWRLRGQMEALHSLFHLAVYD